MLPLIGTGHPWSTAELLWNTSTMQTLPRPGSDPPGVPWAHVVTTDPLLPNVMGSSPAHGEDPNPPSVMPNPQRRPGTTSCMARSGHGKKWFLIHFQVLSSGFKSRQLDAATSHKCLQARQQPEPHHVPPTLLLAVLVLGTWLPQTLRGDRRSREHARSCLLHASMRTCLLHHTGDTPVSPG